MQPRSPSPGAPADNPPDAAPASNAVRLSPGEWLVAAAVLGLLLCCLPPAWKHVEPLADAPDDRIPFRLSNDYWTVQRYFQRACSRQRTLLIGDSVVWGHYVGREETLSHDLNQLGGDRRFANLGVDGIHPLALLGLIEHYGGAVAGRDVILHCNLLWMSSPRHDLRTEKEFAFNHPALVPQFFPRIPCYRASLSARLGHVVTRNVPLLAWTNHLRIAYFDDTDFPYWTIEHPYRSPLGAITLKLPSPDEPPSPRPVAKPWTEQGIRPFNPPWVELETSLQWRAFRRTIEILRRRKNHLFVVLGPFNEAMLGPASLDVYQARKRQAKNWFDENGVPCWVPPPLPSRDYADASHPLAEGYRVLARQLLEDAAFRRFQSGQ